MKKRKAPPAVKTCIMNRFQFDDCQDWVHFSCKDKCEELWGDDWQTCWKKCWKPYDRDVDFTTKQMRWSMRISILCWVLGSVLLVCIINFEYRDGQILLR